MRIIVMPDSFKGTFSSEEVIEHIKRRFSELCPEAEVIGIPMADGGEGTVRALMATHPQAEWRQVQVTPMLPNMTLTNAAFAIDGTTAYIEMAAAAGLTLLKLEERDPLKTSTRGVGELLLAALNCGVKRIYMGIGGSATNDGGMGFAEAIGVQFHGKYPSEYESLPGCGGKLQYLEAIDWSGVDSRLSQVEITVMCDVKNPLTGPKGATYVYGPQKGADEGILEILERGMCHYETLLNKAAVTEMPGAGAAGGLGAALAIYAEARLMSGAALIMEAAGFDEIIKTADLVISGEGCVDEQTLNGKVVDSILKRMHDNNCEIPLVLIAGTKGLGFEGVLEQGVKAIYCTTDYVDLFDAYDGHQYSELLDRAIDACIRSEILKNS